MVGAFVRGGRAVVWCVGPPAGWQVDMARPPGPPLEDAARRLGRELSALGLVLRLTGIGWYVAVCIAGGTVLGYWADGRVGTRPWLMMAGLAVGIAVAFSGMISMLRAVLAGRGDGAPKGDGDER